jgi:hypothetical protein
MIKNKLTYYLVFFTILFYQFYLFLKDLYVKIKNHFPIPKYLYKKEEESGFQKCKV